jgi:hypothetical protein
MQNLRFSGHETFICKQLWPKKGFDFVTEGNRFSDIDAVVKLGVGRNMVLSIRFWLKALGIIDTDENISGFAKLIFDNTGYDPYIEDIGTIWLLHYHLISEEYASVYNLVYNSFLKGKTEYTRIGLLNYVDRKFFNKNGSNINSKTSQTDVSVFFRNYLLPDKSSKNIEEEYAGLFYDLKLLKKYVRSNIEDKREEFFLMEREERNSLPKEIFLYAILNNKNYGNSISLNELVGGHNSVGNIFLLNREGIYKKIEDITATYEFVNFSQTAGVPILQFVDKPNPNDILKKYYEN